MTTTVVSYGRMKLAVQRGETMPQGWSIVEVKPITDPKRATDGLLVLIGGYKGYGLNLVVGALAGDIERSPDLFRPLDESKAENGCPDSRNPPLTSDRRGHRNSHPGRKGATSGGRSARARTVSNLTEQPCPRSSLWRVTPALRRTRSCLDRGRSSSAGFSSVAGASAEINA